MMKQGASSSLSRRQPVLGGLFWVVVWAFVVMTSGSLTVSAQAQQSAGSGYWPEKPSETQLKMGEQVYFKKCVWCHGPEGAGDGPGALRLWPRPRNFNAGTFKIRTTASGELPTDDDLFLTVTNGLPGSAMPAWDGILTPEQRRAVVAFVKTKLVKDRDFQDEEFEEYNVISFDGQVPSSDESIARGVEVFQKKGKCEQCHGPDGRGNGNLTQKDDWGFPIFPADLHECWNFRGNRRDPYNPRNVFREVTTGLNGTPMPSFVDVLSVEERWDVANFVISLCEKGQDGKPLDINVMTMFPKINFVVTAKHTEDAVPDTADDEKWDGQKNQFIGLGGQITRKPQNFNRRIDNLWVKTMYNNEEIAFRLVWDDRTESHKQGGNLPPPMNVADLTIPVAYYANPLVFEEVVPELYPDEYASLPKPVVYNDAVEVQFPAKWQELVSPERPFFIHGDPQKPVDLWRWESDGSTVSYTGHGVPDVKKRADGVFRVTDAKFVNGQWRVVMKRPLTTEDKENDVQFESAKYIPIAFHAWDGNNGEAGGRMSLSAWYYIVLAPPIPIRAFVFPPLVAIFLVGIQWWVIKKAKNAQNGNGK